MKTSLALALPVLLCAAFGAQQRVTPSTKPQDPSTVREFDSRVNKYLSQRNKLGAGPSKPADSAAQVKAREQQLAAKVRQQRANAKQGDIFDSDVAELFRRNLAVTMSGPAGKRIRTSLSHAEPVKNLDLHVNDVYPDNIPLQSTPPSLLQVLPRLPKGLEYRFVERNLILYDSATNLVVDFLPNALP